MDLPPPGYLRRRTKPLTRLSCRESVQPQPTPPNSHCSTHYRRGEREENGKIATLKWQRRKKNVDTTLGGASAIIRSGQGVVLSGGLRRLLSRRSGVGGGGPWSGPGGRAAEEEDDDDASCWCEAVSTRGPRLREAIDRLFAPVGGWSGSRVGWGVQPRRRLGEVVRTLPTTTAGDTARTRLAGAPRTWGESGAGGGSAEQSGVCECGRRGSSPPTSALGLESELTWEGGGPRRALIRRIRVNGLGGTEGGDPDAEAEGGAD
jgi:hypothetical protein